MTYIYAYLSALFYLLAISGLIVFFFGDQYFPNLLTDYLIYLSFFAALGGPISKLIDKRVLAIVLTTLLLSEAVQSDELDFGLGLGVGKSAVNSSVETRVYQGAYIWDLYDGFYTKGKLGYYSDTSGDPFRKSSIFGSWGLGLMVDLAPVEIRVGYGVGGILTPDSYLGGRFPQFNGDLYLGLRDGNGSCIGFSYNHISSASILYPNIGRDFIVLEIGKRW